MSDMIDTFQATSTVLTAHTSDSGHSWTDLFGFPAQTIFSPGHLGLNSATAADLTISSYSPPSANQRAFVLVRNLGSLVANSCLGVGFRAVGTTVTSQSNYTVRYLNGTGWQLIKDIGNNSSGETVVGSIASSAPPDGAIVDVVLSGAGPVSATITQTVSGTPTVVGTITDSSGTYLTAAGSQGVYFYNPSASSTVGLQIGAARFLPTTGPSGVSVSLGSSSITTTGSTTATVSGFTTGATFASSNTAVATVNASTGVVTAVAAGTCNITATGSTFSQETASVTLTVTSSTPPSSGTISGPSSGLQGVASTNFTITLGSAALSGGQVINLTSSVGGDTITPSSLTIASGQTTGTFTIIPSSSGARTITPTSSGVTFTPTSLIYTATNPAATAFTISGPSSGYNHNASTNFTFAPNGTYTGSITPTMTGLAGAWSPSTLSWTGTPIPQTATFTPSATGTGTASGTASPTLTAPLSLSYVSNAQTFAVSPASLNQSVTTTVTFTGQATLWSTTAPTFALSGVSGVTIGTVTVVSNTSATASVTTGSNSGTLTFTDSTSGATATASVTSTVNYLSSVSGFASGLVGTVGYQLYLNGTASGSVVTSGIVELPAGSGCYQVEFNAPSGSLVAVAWENGSGGYAVDSNPQVVPFTLAQIASAVISAIASRTLSLAPAAGSWEEAFASARAGQGVGKVTYTPPATGQTTGTMTVYAHDDATVLKAFTVTTDTSGNVLGRV